MGTSLFNYIPEEKLENGWNKFHVCPKWHSHGIPYSTKPQAEVFSQRSPWTYIWFLWLDGFCEAGFLLIKKILHQLDIEHPSNSVTSHLFTPFTKNPRWFERLLSAGQLLICSEPGNLGKPCHLMSLKSEWKRCQLVDLLEILAILETMQAIFIPNIIDHITCHNSLWMFSSHVPKHRCSIQYAVWRTALAGHDTESEMQRRPDSSRCAICTKEGGRLPSQATSVQSAFSCVCFMGEFIWVTNEPSLFYNGKKMWLCISGFSKKNLLSGGHGPP